MITPKTDLEGLIETVFDEVILSDHTIYYTNDERSWIEWQHRDENGINGEGYVTQIGFPIGDQSISHHMIEGACLKEPYNLQETKVFYSSHHKQTGNNDWVCK